MMTGKLLATCDFSHLFLKGTFLSSCLKGDRDAGEVTSLLQYS